ncbi:MAG: hypothetical protein K2G08_07300, partial [Paramuribaculum sp.]|nr:hypothetical protein [Paramuribaculum sp.]
VECEQNAFPCDAIKVNFLISFDDVQWCWNCERNVWQRLMQVCSSKFCKFASERINHKFSWEKF